MPLPSARASLTINRVVFQRLADLYADAREATRVANQQRYGELRDIVLANDRERKERTAAGIELDFLRDRILGPDTLQNTHRVQIIATISIHDLSPKARFRSAPIAHDAQELVPRWTGIFDLRVDQALDVQLALWVDRGDAAPLRLGVVKMLAPAARDFLEGSHELDRAVNQAGTLAVDTTVACARVVLPRAKPSTARSTDSSSGNRNLIAPVPAVYVELTRIDGLYRPIDPVWTDGGEYQQSEAYAGYTGTDWLGRIFTSRRPDGAWTPFSQYIDLSARVTALGQASAIAAVRDRLPRLTWLVQPMNAAEPLLLTPFAHRDTADVIASGLRGFADGGHRFQWQRQGSDARVSAGTVDTPIDWQVVDEDAVGTARVRLYCPHVAGDQFVVRARVPEAPQYRAFEACTGPMTMWKRIYVDYYRMQTAGQLPVEHVPEVFEPACIELVFVRQARPAAVDPLVDSPDVALVEPEVLRYMTASFGAPAAGRIQLVSAVTPCRLGEPQEGDSLRVDNQRIGYDLHRVAAEGCVNAGGFSPSYLEVAGDLTARGFTSVVLNLGNHTIINSDLLAAVRVDDRTRFWIAGHDLAVTFTRCNGSRASETIGMQRFFPGRVSPAELEPTGQYEDFTRINVQAGGYPVADTSAVNAMLEGGASGTDVPDGISPVATRDGVRWASGRTMLFTRLPNYDDSVPAQVNLIAHELTHAFGMPHKCARYDTRVPRVGNCCMNYPGYWMLVGDQFRAGRDYDRFDGRLCAQHIRALRDVRMEDNLALNWR